MVKPAAVFILGKNIEPFTAQTPSFHRKICDHLPQVVRQQVISDTPPLEMHLRPSLILSMTSLASAPIGRSARQPSVLTSGGWCGERRGGRLCSKCSAVAMVTVDAECCWVLCVGRVWIVMTSFTESEEKQLLLQLLGLLICVTITPNVILVFMKDIWQETPGNYMWFCAKQTGSFLFGKNLTNVIATPTFNSLSKNCGSRFTRGYMKKSDKNPVRNHKIGKYGNCYWSSELSGA